ncbi:MAG: DUF4266 domain-containing protein [Polyangiaceae bacterium]|nr:DUF4266 domain-containing protein [Polyangiaceae bacterium]
MRALFGFFVILVGCAEVAPWQRETIASDRMNLDGDGDEQAMVASRRRTREEAAITSSGTGASASGGACGCN